MTGIKYKSIKKSRNKTIKILAKLKNWNLPKSKFRNLLRSKIFIKFQNISTSKQLNFLILNTKVVFNKLR